MASPAISKPNSVLALLGTKNWLRLFLCGWFSNVAVRTHAIPALPHRSLVSRGVLS